MARLYSNENFPLPVVESLRQSGHDVLTIQETGFAAKATPDEQVLAFAIKEDRILLTFNRKHFIQLHRKTPDHAGIIICTYDPDFAALAQRIHQEISQHPTSLACYFVSTAPIGCNGPLLLLTKLPTQTT